MPEGINLAKNVARLRKAHHMTQDEVAGHLGVTKASVSKWETAQSFPDLALLPRLASLFDVSIDALMGYEPQLSPAGVRQQCVRLREEFAARPFDEALDSCVELTKEYYSCPGLLAQVASILVNHTAIAEDDAARDRLQALATELCRRVRELDCSVTDLRLANALEGAVELMRGRPDRTAELVEGACAPEVGELVLLASAHLALGDRPRAEQVLQAGLFQMLCLSLNVLSQMAPLDAGDPDRLRLTHERALAIVDGFDMDGLFLNACAVHLSFAVAYASCGAVDEAIGCLERYLAVCKRMDLPPRLHGDGYFDKLDAWFADVGVDTSVPLGQPFFVRQFYEGVAENPAFAPLAGDGRFRRIVKELEVAFR